MAQKRSFSPPLFAAAITGVAAGTIVAILMPGTLGIALGIMLSAGGVLLSLVLAERRALARHEQVFAAIGEVKVRLATHSIRIDGLDGRARGY